MLVPTPMPAAIPSVVAAMVAPAVMPAAVMTPAVASAVLPALDLEKWGFLRHPFGRNWCRERGGAERGSDQDGGCGDDLAEHD